MRLRSDRGIVTVLFALFVVALMAMVAVVIDIGRIRNARHTSQSAADFAALAAGEELATDDGNPRQACRDALAYLVANVDDLPTGTTLPCDSMPLGCGPTTTPTTVTDGGTAAPYTVEITYPVPDADLADPSIGGLRVADGEPCDRFGVELAKTIQALFAGVVGVTSLDTDAGAVARATPGALRQAPNLWLLDPTGCTALSVQGGSHLTVGTATAPGLITLDSDGSTCSSNAHTIDVGGSGSVVEAIPPGTSPPGRISLVAMTDGQVRCDDGNPAACEQVDVDAGRLTPQPTRRYQRATRATVDHRFNCRATYPDYHGIPIEGCPDAGTRPAYIDDLRAAIGPSGAPAGFQRWRASYGCNDPTVPASLPGNWWIDCPTFRISNANINFSGGNIVFDGDVAMTGGSLSFNTANPSAALPSACLATMAGCAASSAVDAAYAFLRTGDLKMSSGSLNANRTAIILDDGDLQIAGGAPPRWTAPRSGPLTALALWAEQASTRFRINGGASMELEGVFFTPEADAFTLTGGSPLIPQKAQFISYRLAISGGGQLSLDPEGLSLLEFAPEPAVLIR
ncbi:MAG TPA: pilus assembly protein TadG-related protein [Acidimicrobiales bacterium]